MGTCFIKGSEVCGGIEKIISFIQITSHPEEQMLDVELREIYVDTPKEFKPIKDLEIFKIIDSDDSSGSDSPGSDLSDIDEYLPKSLITDNYIIV